MSKLKELVKVGDKVQWIFPSKPERIQDEGVVEDVTDGEFHVRWTDDTDQPRGRLVHGYSLCDLEVNGGNARLFGKPKEEPMQKSKYPLIDQLKLTHLPMRSWNDGKTEIDCVCSSDLERLLHTARVAYGCGCEDVGSLVYGPDVKEDGFEITALVFAIKQILPGVPKPFDWLRISEGDLLIVTSDRYDLAKRGETIKVTRIHGNEYFCDIGITGGIFFRDADRNVDFRLFRQSK